MEKQVKEPAAPHYLEHRKRLRQRFLKAGFEGFQDYEALELLLTYAIPRRDVKPLAKALLKRFDSFRGVLDATKEELMELKGIKENAAVYIGALKECASLYLKDDILRRKQISSTSVLLDYCRLAMSGLKDEQFRTVFLNSQNEVIAEEVMGEGTVDQSAVYPRKIMERALFHKATALIFVHNHPGGSSKPSTDDKRLTEDLVRAARSLQIKVHDHLIVCRSGYFSFLERGML